MDPLTEFEENELKSQIEEANRFYKLSKVSDVGRKKGQMAIAFKHPRRGILRRLVPHLKEKGIPLTFFLRVDCVGLNQLPPGDEVQDIEKMDPEAFLSTWGQLVALGPQMEMGLHAGSRTELALQKDKTFIEQRIGRKVKSAFLPESDDVSILHQLGISAVVVEKKGMINLSNLNEPFPYWPFEPSECM